MASSKQILSVRTVGLPDHERIILGLVFDVSQRSGLRAYAYTLVDADSADLILCDANFPLKDSETPAIFVTDAPTRDARAPVVLRPLIATRVLTVLDEFAARLEDDTAPAAVPVAGDVPEPSVKNTLAAIDKALLNDDLENYTAEVKEPEAVHRARALVIDVSASVRKQVEFELVHFNVAIEYVASARQALQLLDAVNYDIVFVDAALPEVDGFQICKRIKTRSRHTRVVLMTTKATTEDKIKGTLAGCDAVLVKPFSRLVFQSTVKTILPSASGARELNR